MVEGSLITASNGKSLVNSWPKVGTDSLKTNEGNLNVLVRFAAWGERIGEPVRRVKVLKEKFHARKVNKWQLAGRHRRGHYLAAMRLAQAQFACSDCAFCPACV